MPLTPRTGRDSPIHGTRVRRLCEAVVFHEWLIVGGNLLAGEDGRRSEARAQTAGLHREWKVGGAEQQTGSHHLGRPEDSGLGSN